MLLINLTEVGQNFDFLWKTFKEVFREKTSKEVFREKTSKEVFLEKTSKKVFPKSSQCRKMFAWLTFTIEK